MDKTFFPGYGRCITCQNLIQEAEFHNHALTCRPKPSNEKKICSLCNQSFDNKQFKQHTEICNQKIQNDNDEEGFQTPRAQTPTQDDKTSKHKIDQTDFVNRTKQETKLCGLCKQQIDQSEYRNHVASCSVHQNRTKGASNDRQSSIEISKQNATKLCTLCKQQIDQADFVNHLQSCSNNQIDDEYPQEEENIPRKKVTKSCGLCKQQIDQTEYRNHVASCSVHQNRTKSTSNDRQSSIEISKQNATKLCILCKQQIDQADFVNHLQSCSNNNQIDDEYPQEEQNIPKKKVTKSCGLCKQQIDQAEYRNHVASCSINRSSLQNEKNSLKKSKFCTLCSESFDESEYGEHVQVCLNNDNHRNKNRQSTNSFQIEKRETKLCGLCKRQIDSSEYRNHVASCSNMRTETDKVSLMKKKQCIFCSQSFNESEYGNHAINCSSEPRRKNFDQDDFQRNSITTSDHFSNNEKRFRQDSSKKRRDCIICFKPIDQSQYEDHVSACVAELDRRSSISTTNNKQTCFICHCSIKKEDKTSYEILCHSHHTYCLSCLRESMEEFARNRETPICHRTLCDYQLSLYDISLIPLERHLSNRLLKLAKGEQRPFCSKCHFYVHITENCHFDEHFEMCGEAIPCEYCELPFPFNQLEDHTKQCRNDQSSSNEKLINFILPRTKYPFTKEQIRIFIQNHRNQSDPTSIVEALAVYGPIFPYEIPTRECGICMESHPYDDIYVFDCDESHKTCYNCYYQSCQTKMNAGEILTCAICAYPLRDGELNQLRVPYDQLKIIRDYQMKKTFDVYSSRTQGIIKCPNQNCTWVAEAEDPNERFRVQCPKCMKEFCSLCNQQYHYRTACQQLPQITQRWFFWCETERGRYLNMRAQQDAQYANQLDEYNRQTNENNNRNNDLRRRYEELMNDEQYKAQNCRLCPSCNRVVQRLEGCDSMVCGQDAHGGNLQSGCGKKFNWAQAKPYTAAATKQPKQVIVDLPKPDNPVVHHDGVKCDHCQNDVDGIRFDCVHCPALTFCEKCEQEATLHHSRENQAFEQQQHVFKLIMVPEEEATQF